MAMAKRDQTEKDRLTPERIVQIARAKGIFDVSRRFRDEWLVGRCKRLVAAGLLRRVRNTPGSYCFKPVEGKEPE